MTAPPPARRARARTPSSPWPRGLPRPDHRRSENVVGDRRGAGELAVVEVLGLDLQALPEPDVDAARDPVDGDVADPLELGGPVVVAAVDRDPEGCDLERQL